MAGLNSLAEQSIAAAIQLFRSLGPVQQIPEEQRLAAPGMLERSAANPITEMMSMIETTRAYESNINMIKSQDEALGNLLGRVLRQS